MKIRILMDNNAPEGLACEWGFSALIEHEKATVLLDAGASPAFAQNAQALGINLNDVDVAILSHAHFDHADGMPAFFDANDHAKFYLRAGSMENCFGLKEGRNEYIGIESGILENYRDRIEFVENDCELAPGIWVITHKTPGLAAEGERQNMLIATEAVAAELKHGDIADDSIGLIPDDFSHEQSLVIDSPEGLVIFSSCSHAGIDAIISEVTGAIPGKHVRMLVGGLHLFLDSEQRVRALASRIRELEIEHIVTGHCTGDAAFSILHEELGDVVSPLYVGLEMTL